ncbi:AMP-binding protein [Muricauda sp. CAU 1633]|uniref:AMP-binding protein n=1 Tax=Allomuricauda sp. CAU 1633 TaxID=2816036 RepID=UPI001A8EB31F|nr:AMP-binding protein [Muricauda sp. CAU 1633]MBO0323389.1 AMP-binding protein [Muricauda sp. CAU 1633]
MENPIWHNIHPQFKLNGTSYHLEDLKEIGYSLVKEGDPFELSLGDFILDWTSEKPTLEVFTSGSTGKPKKIALLKEHMVNSAKATGAYFGLAPNHTALLCLPCSGIAGKMMLVRAMVLGLQLDYVEPSSTPLSTNEKAYDFVAMVPLQVQSSLEHLDRIKIVIIGGAPVDITLRSKLKNLPTQCYETYGMTETITHIAVKRMGDGSIDYFETLPNVTISVDARDCLVINAPKVLNDQIVTNDVVELAGENQFKWLGRYDSIINSGGVKLIPEQIEKKLSSIINSRFFVAGLPDAVLGQQLVLVIEESQVDSEVLLSKIKKVKGLHKYEVPKKVVALKPFIETKTGKIHRKKIMEQIR